MLNLVTDRDNGPFLLIIIPVPVIVRNKPGLTGTIFTKVLFVQDCKYLFSLRRVDFYYLILGSIATRILMLNLKVDLKYTNKMSFK